MKENKKYTQISIEYSIKDLMIDYIQMFATTNKIQRQAWATFLP